MKGSWRQEAAQNETKNGDITPWADATTPGDQNPLAGKGCKSINLRRLASWFAVSILLAMLGAIFGLVSLALVWEFIYAVGDSVVSDEKYLELLLPVRAWGAQVGACSGLAVGMTMFDREPVKWLAILNFGCTLAGMFGGSSGWHVGLVAFFAAHTAGGLLCGLCPACRYLLFPGAVLRFPLTKFSSLVRTRGRPGA